jgi:hypothetical protein
MLCLSSVTVQRLRRASATMRGVSRRLCSQPHPPRRVLVTLGRPGAASFDQRLLQVLHASPVFDSATHLQPGETRSGVPPATADVSACVFWSGDQADAHCGCDDDCSRDGDGQNSVDGCLAQLVRVLKRPGDLRHLVCVGPLAQHTKWFPPPAQLRGLGLRPDSCCEFCCAMLAFILEIFGSLIAAPFRMSVTCWRTYRHRQ